MVTEGTNPSFREVVTKRKVRMNPLTHVCQDTETSSILLKKFFIKSGTLKRTNFGRLQRGTVNLLLGPDWPEGKERGNNWVSELGKETRSQCRSNNDGNSEDGIPETWFRWEVVLRRKGVRRISDRGTTCRLYSGGISVETNGVWMEGKIISSIFDNGTLYKNN